MTAADRDLTGLLRWYPRAWRERYGEEFLALVEDTLDGRRPGWRLHLGVIRAGLRERARRAVPAALRRMTADAEPPSPPGRLGMLVVAISAVLFWSTKDLSWVSLSADARRYASGAVTADAIAALWILIGVAGTAASLAAGPAFARFLRAGGWPEVRWQVARAAGVTAAAAVALTRLHLLERSMTFEQAPGSAAYLGWFFAALALLWAMLLLWRQAAMTVAARLELSPRVRAAQIVLYAVTTTAAFAIPSVAQIWIGQIKPDNWMLGTGALWLVFFFRSEPARLWWAWHRAKQLRAAAE